MVHGPTRLSEIVNLASPQNAPLTLRFSSVNGRLFQTLRKQSFPRGEARERGGTIVADKDGVLSLKNIGGLASTSRNFSPNYVLKDGNRYRVIGFFHTHPHDRSEGFYTGDSFSSVDVENLLYYQHTLIMDQSGPRLFAILRTQLSPRSIDHLSNKNAMETRIRSLMEQGRSFPQSTRIAAKELMDRYNIAYYQGSNGVVTRV